MNRFFLSRRTVLVLILLILFAMTVGYLFPQRFTSSPEAMEAWLDKNPFWDPWMDRLDLDHVYTSWWFSVFLSLFFLALVLSTIEQVRISFRRTFGGGSATGEDLVEVTAGEGAINAALRRRGFRKTYEGNGIVRFLKHPWGYWGNVLLHFGIAVVILSSLLIVLTQKRGLLNLIEGEVYVPGGEWTVVETGVLADEFVLPEAVRLDYVTPEFWETDDLKQLTTAIRFVDPQGRFRPHILSINNSFRERGIQVYQGKSFGHAFFLELADEKGLAEGVILQIDHPQRRDQASYGNHRFDNIPYFVKAKYFADVDLKTMIGGKPLLFVRLTDGGEVLGEVELLAGESGQLGPYAVKLVGVSKWAGVIFTELTGMPGIFFGFFIIIVGGGLTYFFPPREVILRAEGGAFSVSGKAARFEGFYRDEFEGLLTEFGRKDIS